MERTIDRQSRIVTNGEMQAAIELCARLERLELLENIWGDGENRHRAWIFTPKGIKAMSLEARSRIGEQIENASNR
jgi:hypothetical protein